MTKRLKIYFSLLLILLAVWPLNAQDNRTLDTKVADLLVQMPANNLSYRDKLMTDMWTLGEDVHRAICKQIVKPGTGDDTKARFAMGSLSKYLSADEQKDKRVQWEQTLLSFIKTSTDKEVQAFFIRQLEFIGSDASLPVLDPYLTDEELAAPAIKSMLMANPRQAAKYFSQQLNRASPAIQAMLIKGIGQAKDASYANQLATLYPTASTEVQRTILNALSQMASPASEEVLLSQAKDAKYNPEATNAVFALLDYGQTIASTDSKTATKVAKTVLKKSTAVQVRINALLLLSRIEEPAQRDALLVSALKDNDPTYRGAAIEEALRVQSPADIWVNALQKNKNPEVQQEVLYLLGQLKDATAADAVSPFLDNSHSVVRAEAAISYALLAKDKAVKGLVEYLDNHSESTDMLAAHDALMLVLSNDNIATCFKSYPTLTTHAKMVMIKIWGEKKISKAFNIVLKEAQGASDELRSTAFANLKYVVTRDHTRQLLTLFESLNDAKEIAQTGEAIVAAVQQDGMNSKTLQAVHQAATSSSDKQRYIPVFSAIGGKDAVEAVLKQYQQTQSETALNALINWGDHHAAGALYTLCQNTNLSKDHKAKAFNGYVQMINKASLPADQKLLLLRKIMPMATDTEGKNKVIKALANVKTFLSFVFVSQYLDDTSLQNDAANTLAHIAMPDPGQDNGLSGQLVVERLKKAKELLSGPDSQYLKIDIETYLSGLSNEKGFVSMFNGKDLSGWQGFVTNPIKKQQLSAARLRQLQKEANKKMTENWSVKDGMIVFNGKGQNLCSMKDYGDFEMIVDWRITKEGDSGIYLRGTPQVQVWDTSRVEVGAQVGSGGLYNNQKHESKPLVIADNPIGDWNTFYIKMVGERVTVYLNGLLVVDNVVMENYWDRSLPIFPEGPIELQAHGTDLAFRDIYVREINSSEYNLSTEEKEEGFVALFNGSDLTGWVGNKTDYKVENSEIVIRPKSGGHGNLYTEKEYTDFIYRFEFKLTPGANNGLGIRAPLEGDAAYVGMELQILDNTAPVYANLKPYQYHGSVYGVIPAKRGLLKPVGEWNSEEVIVKGNHVKVILNGEVIVDGNIAEASKNGTMDGKEHPGLQRTSGHIGFLGHGSEVYFRNIRIKEL